MSMTRREFLEVMAVAAASGMALNSRQALAGEVPKNFYELPKFGNVSFMHFTDCHAQLLPVYFREPNVNIGVGGAYGKAPHLVGDHFLKAYGIKPGSIDAHAFTQLDFVAAAKTYGKVGGFAHLATLIKNIRAQRPGSLLLDSGDTWQGSGTAYWTNGADMVGAQKMLGVNVMAPHWEFTLGAERVKEIVEKDFKGSVDFVAQNVKTADFGDQVFKPYVIKNVNGVPVAIIGQAFPYTPVANPRHFTPDWTFGIQDDSLQKFVDEARGKGAKVVVVLSHNGMDVDLKMATRVTGVDVIFGGHTHDAIPQAIPVKNSKGTTLVTNAGSNGKFLGVMDLDVKNGKVVGYKYRLLPVFSNLIEADKPMADYIKKVRAPFETKLNEKLAVTEDFLYRRGNFNGTFDQVIVDALIEVKGADMAFSPGFRWGTSLIPGDTITMERVLDQTCITYPATTLNEMTGQQIKEVLEDVGDNLFNPDPYYQQGGDMVRVGGLQYTINPNEKVSRRVSNMVLRGKAVDPNKKYLVAGWASVQENVTGTPIWDVVAEYLKNVKVIKKVKPNQPKLIGMSKNPGMQE
ncbi:MAG: thiosulfohydrolase SoxB [Burkholderiales bacterium]|nr:thiosulfohydrolase SoxB [Burkholderiales bacterium]